MIARVLLSISLFLGLVKLLYSGASIGEQFDEHFMGVI